MKKSLILGLAALFSAAHLATADVTITQEIQQPDGSKSTSITKIKGDKLRTDVGKEATAIIDTKTGDTTTLMHAQKVAMKLPGDMVKNLQKQAMAQMNPSQEEVAEPKATGRTETINGFKCEEYTFTHAGTKMAVWVTKDIPDMTEITKQLESLTKDDPFQSALKDKKIDGFPVRTSVELPNTNAPLVMTVVGINRDPLPAKDFEIPSGYNEVAMPVMPSR